MRRFLTLAAAFACLALGIALRKLMPKPYVWNFAFLAWAISSMILAVAVRNIVIKYFFIFAFSLLAALFIAETLLAFKAPVEHVQARPQNVPIEQIRKDRNEPDLLPKNGNILHRDAWLGYRPKAEPARVATRTTWQGKIVSDVVYSFNEQGWRVTPAQPEARKAVVVFGCSVAFGQGLNDEESIPYVLGELLGPEWQVYNFAYAGYGAHQMLAQIQGGILEEPLRRHERLETIFLTIRSHESRCAGMVGWDTYGPWYVVENGRAVRKGNFTDRPGRVLPALEKNLRNCLVYQDLLGRPALSEEQALDLHAVIIAEADVELEERYNLRLTTALWPGAPFAPLLGKRGLKMLDLRPAFPEAALLPLEEAAAYNLGLRPEYRLFMDNHPDARAARFAAQRIADAVRQAD